MIEVKRTGIVIRPNPARVFFRPLDFLNRERLTRVIARVTGLEEKEVTTECAAVLELFHKRHINLNQIFLKRFEEIRPHLISDAELSENRKLLIGAYFCQEYSLEAAALFNPSMVVHPDQSNLPEGALRTVVSLRATGEGHVSSIVFRSVIVHADLKIELLTPTPYVTAPAESPESIYEKNLFERKLVELGLLDENSASVLSALQDTFTLRELKDIVERTKRKNRFVKTEEQSSLHGMVTLALSNYQIRFAGTQRMSERVIFPAAPSEQRGIEDARFVTFREDCGSIKYYGTYTAYDGQVIFPQLIETTDFESFKVSTLNGPEVQNKGMALFPRKIKGSYAMISRQDGENLYLMYSDLLHFWYTKQLLLRPTYPWEFVQIGNCGSPIETDEGWLVLTHGVGPMRQYSIGAILLDLEDPSKVIGRLKKPLLSPNEEEREGYVPNVVYSCGGLVHRGHLVLPYAMSDTNSTFATIELKALLSELKRS